MSCRLKGLDAIHRCLRCSIKLTEDNLWPIFNRFGRRLNLRKMLKKCSRINVIEDPKITQALCQSCVDKLIDEWKVVRFESQTETGLSSPNCKVSRFFESIDAEQDVQESKSKYDVGEENLQTESKVSSNISKILPNKRLKRTDITEFTEMLRNKDKKIKILEDNDDSDTSHKQITLNVGKESEDLQPDSTDLCEIPEDGDNLKRNQNISLEILKLTEDDKLDALSCYSREQKLSKCATMKRKYSLLPYHRPNKCSQNARSLGLEPNSDNEENSRKTKRLSFSKNNSKNKKSPYMSSKAYQKYIKDPEAHSVKPIPLKAIIMQPENPMTELEKIETPKNQDYLKDPEKYFKEEMNVVASKSRKELGWSTAYQEYLFDPEKYFENQSETRTEIAEHSTDQKMNNFFGENGPKTGRKTRKILKDPKKCFEKLGCKDESNQLSRDNSRFPKHVVHLKKRRSEDVSRITKLQGLNRNTKTTDPEIVITNLIQETFSNKRTADEETYDFPIEEIDLMEFKKSMFPTEIDIKYSVAHSCRICFQKLHSHKEHLEHLTVNHLTNDYLCLLNKNCGNFESLENLSIHMIFKHSDLKNLKIDCFCPICNYKFKNIVDLNKHTCYQLKRFRDQSDKKKTCNICKKFFATEKRLNFHIQFHNDKHRPKACLICDFKFTNYDKMFDHLFFAHDGYNLNLICRECDVIFSHSSYYNEHIRKFHKIMRKEFNCSICDRKFVNEKIFQTHIRCNHPEDPSKRFRCEYCGKLITKFYEDMYKHIRKFHLIPKENEVLSCKKCGFLAEDDKAAKFHEDAFHAEHIFDNLFEKLSLKIGICCEYCEMAFKSIECLKEHLESHPDNEYYCDVCGETFNTVKKLRKHSSKHSNTGEKTKSFPLTRHYVCLIDDCPATYPALRTIITHRKLKHVNTENFKCKYCPAEFKTWFTNRKHCADLHPNGKKEKDYYVCEICDKKFTSKTGYSLHKTWHKSEMGDISQRTCELCLKKFHCPSKFREHNILLHTKFNCRNCGEIFELAKDFIYHFRDEHKSNECYLHIAEEFEKGSNQKSTRAIQLMGKFKCSICNFCATSRFSFKYHCIGHRPYRKEKKYSCNDCNMKYQTEIRLEMHRKSVHSINL